MTVYTWLPPTALIEELDGLITMWSRTPVLKSTAACWLRVTPSPVALYVTLSGVESVEVNEATPDESLVPVPPEESVAPPVCPTVTALPATGLPYWSFSVTVTVAV